MRPSAATWPASRAGEAIAALAEAADLEPRPERVGPPPGDAFDEGWLIDTARWLAIAIEPVTTPYPDVAAMIAAPAIARVGSDVLAIVAVRRGHVLAIQPDLRRVRVPLADVVAALRAPVEASAPIPELAIAGVDRDRLRAAQLRFTPVGGVALVRRTIHTRARDLHLGRRFAGIAALHLVGYLMSLASWWTIGRTILSGRIDPGWLAAWALLVATSVLARLASTARSGPLAIDAATLLREHLLAGALRIPADAIRGDGAGRALGRVFEANALEQLAVTGAFTAMFAAIELVVVAVVLALGAGGAIHVALLVATLAAAAVVVRRYVRARARWTSERLALTHDFVDNMLGHATRLAQQPAGDRHAREDAALVRYGERSSQLDRGIVWLQAALPRGWLVVATLGLVPALAGPLDVPALAIALGGVLLGASALTKLGDAATHLADAAIAWRSVAPLVDAGRRPPAAAPPALASTAPSPDQPLAVVRGVNYRRVLADCDLEIRAGDHVVLEGASGAGKSTLGSVLAGLRRPDAGLVLAGGLDLATLGESGWRRRIAMVPQFHDNHVFYGSLAFNLLMARTWPPGARDLADADAVCRDLGLGALLDRMPGGLFQLVGETGWTLSHGERSRVFVARALLAGAPLVILDESLAALDPDTIVATLACIERRARAALVIAHP